MLGKPDGLTNSPVVHVLTLTLTLHWDKPEDVMNKLMTAAVLAGGLMLLNSPEAAAHKQVRNVYQPPAYAHAEWRRPHHMPGWLKQQRAFRHWYRHTPLKRDRRLAWHQLYEIFRWEHRRGAGYRRNDNYWHNYYERRYGERERHRDQRNKPRRHH